MITIKLKNPIERIIKDRNNEDVRELSSTFQFPDYNFYEFNLESNTWDFYKSQTNIKHSFMCRIKCLHVIKNNPDMSINASEINSIIRS